MDYSLLLEVHSRMGAEPTTPVAADKVSSADPRFFEFMQWTPEAGLHPLVKDISHTLGHRHGFRAIASSTDGLHYPVLLPCHCQCHHVLNHMMYFTDVSVLIQNALSI